jgi:hypothetical protein
LTQPSVPATAWQITGNHWVALPCIHPDDASVHTVGLLHRGSRGAIEFAGSSGHLRAEHPAFLELRVIINGTQLRLAEAGVVWERVAGWIPAFSTSVDGVSVRGTIFAPHGREADVPGFVYSVAIENKSGRTAEIDLEFVGCLGHRQLRVRTARAFADAHHVAEAPGAVLILDGVALPGVASIAFGAEGDPDVRLNRQRESMTFGFGYKAALAEGERWNAALYAAAGAERDGASATLSVLRRKGWKELLQTTTRTLSAMSQDVGDGGVAQLINRNLFFAYFFGVGRAIDDAQFYMVRSRAPWHERGLTIRDWESLIWLLPAVQLMDGPLARELILRACEVHGYAPGHGLHYLDGAVFEPGFSLEGAAAYAIAVDRYIRETGDDQIIQEPILADTLYLSHDEISRRRHPQYPLYSTEVLPDGGAAPLGYTLHGNAAAALALDVFSRTLDESSAQKVEPAAAVRAAMMRHFSRDRDASTGVLATAIDVNGAVLAEDFPDASAIWLAHLEAVERTNSTFRRTVRSFADSSHLSHWCARLAGPSASEAAAFLRRAELYEGIACETVSETGQALSGAGDAVLAGLLAWSMWQALHVQGVKV